MLELRFMESIGSRWKPLELMEESIGVSFRLVILLPISQNRDAFIRQSPSLDPFIVMENVIQPAQKTRKTGAIWADQIPFFS